MTQSYGRYHFRSWVRRGVGADAGQADSPAIPARASMDVELSVTAHQGGAVVDVLPAPKVTVHLFGPGDVIGIDPRHIIRTEPRNLTVNFEPNYLAGIEFDGPDFPWLFTPALANADRLRPWIALIVLKDAEYTTPSVAPNPLPVIDVTRMSALQTLDDSWNWAHAQISAETDLTATIAGNPAAAISRLLCPRRLDPAGRDRHVGLERVLRSAEEREERQTRFPCERIEDSGLDRAARRADVGRTRDVGGHPAPPARVGADDARARGKDARARELLRLPVERRERRRLPVPSRAAGELDGDEEVSRDVLRAARNAERGEERDVERRDFERADGRAGHPRTLQDASTRLGGYASLSAGRLSIAPRTCCLSASTSERSNFISSRVSSSARRVSRSGAPACAGVLSP